MGKVIIGVVSGIILALLGYSLYRRKLNREALEFDNKCLSGGGTVEIPGEVCNNNDGTATQRGGHF
tara:strand:+ start:1353 stop:1550 length:198 start_codon:yes stop_codon:yes gene_type:complete